MVWAQMGHSTMILGRRLHHGPAGGQGVGRGAGGRGHEHRRRPSTSAMSRS